MKYVLIFCAVLIAGSILLNKHLENKRYQNPSPYDYAVSEKIDANYHDASVVEAYYVSAQKLGNYARSEWFNHKIDVRHPKEGKKGAADAARNYTYQLAQVQLLEHKLIQSAEMKKKGLNNEQVAAFEDLGEHPVKRALREKFASLRQTPLHKGDKGQLVMEVQKLLAENGSTLRVDGIFNEETASEIRKVQDKNGLYASGTADWWLIEVLL